MCVSTDAKISCKLMCTWFFFLSIYFDCYYIQHICGGPNFKSKNFNGNFEFFQSLSSASISLVFLFSCELSSFSLASYANNSFTQRYKSNNWKMIKAKTRVFYHVYRKWMKILKKWKKKNNWNWHFGSLNRLVIIITWSNIYVNVIIAICAIRLDPFSIKYIYPMTLKCHFKKWFL